jgi:hypothetical protein
MAGARDVLPPAYARDMAQSTFDELLQWLQEHDGRSVYLEVGTDAPDTAQPADAFPVAMHVTLNGIQSATNLDRPDRMAVMVRLDGGDQNRLYLEPDRITKILIHGGVKIWFLERFYVGLS